ncbi:MAG: CAP domain-containing protein [Planctomycetota bacterium]
MGVGTPGTVGLGRGGRRAPRLRSVVVWMLATWSATRVLAQEEPAPPVDIPALARTVRRADLDPAEQDVAAQALLDAGERGAVALLEALRLESTEAAKAFRSESARLRAAFERRARAVLDKRKGKDGDKRIGALRYEILQRSRGPDLTKDAIHDEIDPRLGELRALLTVDVDTVLAATPALVTARERARALAARLVRLFELRVMADARLADSAAGRSLLERQPSPADPRDLAASLDADLAVRAAAATPASQRDARTLQANEVLAEGVDAQEKAGVSELNRIRLLLGLPVLLIDVKLCAAARDHSADMAELGFFSHTSPVAGKETFAARAARAGTSASAENIAAGQATGAAAIGAWWYSPGHHRNMMADALRVGLGRRGTHWTQMFGQ